MFRKLFKKLQQRSRKKKFTLFMNHLKPKDSHNVLDMGCGTGTFLEEMYPFKKKLLGFDISPRNIKIFKQKHPSVKIMQGDGKKSPFKNQEFDIVFSNAVIEHVGNWNEQKKYASEIRRVAKSYFITTPNKWFPFEPHYRLPLYQFIPKQVQKLLSKHFSIGNYPKGFWEDIHLISASELATLFPEATIVKQKIGFYPETLIAIYKEKK